MRRMFELTDKPPGETVFIKVQAAVPFLVPEGSGHNAVKAELDIDTDDNVVTITTHSTTACMLLMDKIRHKNLRVRIEEDNDNQAEPLEHHTWKLSKQQQAIADKLTDAGIEQEDAEMWIRSAVEEGMG